MSARRDALFALALWRVQGTFPASTLRSAREHAFALELTGAVLRHKASLEWILKRCVKRLPTGELWAALMVGAAQLLCMPGVAEHAAISETVEAAKPIGRGAAALTNAVLRRIQREREALLAALEQQPEALRRNVPPALWKRWCATFGEAETRRIAAALEVPPRVCVRPLPPHLPPPACEAHPADPQGTFLVPRGVKVEALEGFESGRFVVQDAATRHAVELLEVRPGMRVLDVCAAPGGKTAQIAARLQGQGRLVANEVSPARMETLRKTLARCRVEAPLLQLTMGDGVRLAETLRGERFERILLDVPCSNTGVMGRRPDARWTWSQKKMEALCQTQAALLEGCAELLEVGGILVYSTCSIEPEEDGAQVERFLAAHPAFRLEESVLEVPGSDHDGAFAAKIVRLC